MNNVILSICIPVYNQRVLLERVLIKLINFDNPNFEIVVCDNASNENIRSLIMELNDSRIVYYRNNVNLGQDLNILQCLKKAKGKYAYLLRTKDYLLPGAISKLFDVIIHNPNMSLLISSKLEGDIDVSDKYDLGNQSKEFDNTYTKGSDALIRALNLQNHPFGVMYSLDKLNLEKIEQYIQSISVDDIKNIYCVTKILHYEAAVSGDIMTISQPLWVHGDDIHSALPSSNAGDNIAYPYSPEITCLNYEILSNYIFQNFYLDFAQIYLINNFKNVLQIITYIFKIRNSNPLYHSHYLVKKIPHDNSFERKKLIKITYGIINKYIENGDVAHRLFRNCKQLVLWNRTIGFFKYLIDYSYMYLSIIAMNNSILKRYYNCIKLNFKMKRHR